MTEVENNHVKNIYDKIASDFSNKRYQPWTWITTFLDSLNQITINNILDVGCGNGRNMLDKRYNFIGIDNCDKFIEMCRNKKLNVIKSDMTALPFEDNIFDAIISIASFHHLSSVDRRVKCLCELKRILKPNGKMLLSVWSYNQTHNKKLNFVYGDNYVPWKDCTFGAMELLKDRGMQTSLNIFNKKELQELLEKVFKIISWEWNHGNEIIVLQKA